MKIADGPVTLESNCNGDDYGYLRWRDYHSSYPNGERVVYVHQLSAIAAGADPAKVFSDGDFVTHHVDGIPENNGRENLLVISDSGHIAEHDFHRRKA